MVLNHTFLEKVCNAGKLSIDYEKPMKKLDELTVVQHNNPYQIQISYIIL
jgi:hypothetical protein